MLHFGQPFAHDISDWNQYLKDAKNLPLPEWLDESDSGQLSEDGHV